MAPALGMRDERTSILGRDIEIGFDPEEIAHLPAIPRGKIVHVYSHPPPPLSLLIDLGDSIHLEWRVPEGGSGRARWVRRPIRFRYVLLHVWRRNLIEAIGELRGSPPNGHTSQRIAFAKTDDLARLTMGDTPDPESFGSLGPALSHLL